MLIYTTALLLPYTSLGVPVSERTGSDSSDRESNGTTAAWKTTPNVRSTYDLLSACFVTLTICAWSAYHPNIPARTSWRSLLGRRLKWVLVAVFAPELVILLACSQVHAAWDLMKEINATLKLRSLKQTLPLSLLSPYCRKNCKFAAASSDEVATRIAPSSTWPATKASNVKINVHSSHSYDLSSNNSSLPGEPRPWTLWEALFALSGGIAVHSDSFYPLNRITFGPKGLLVLARLGILPMISKEDIQDKSKADSFAKAILCLQAGWFFVQSIGRLQQGLPLTLLEIHTNTHIFCALILYAVWTRKPYDITRPLFVQDERVIDIAALLVSQPARVIDPDRRETARYCCSQSDSLTLEHVSSAHQTPCYNVVSWKHFTQQAMEAVSRLRYGESSNFVWIPKPLEVDQEHAKEQLKRANRALQYMRYKGYHFAWTEREPCSGSYLPPRQALQPCINFDGVFICFNAASVSETMLDENDMVSYSLLSSVRKCEPKDRWEEIIESQKPMTGNNANPKLARERKNKARWSRGLTKSYAFVSQQNLRKPIFTVVCAGYGGAHLSAWNNPFPTSVEKWMWRVGCICLAAGPLMWFLHFKFWDLQDRIQNARVKNKDAGNNGRAGWWTFLLWLHRIPKYIVLVLVATISCVYIPARFYIVIEALVSLRSPAPGTYRTVNWANYIPHAS